MPMIREFYLSFEGDKLDAKKIKHIQYNITKRIKKLKYVTYRRIDISFVATKTTEQKKAEVRWNDKTAVISCSLKEENLNDLNSNESIVAVYKSVFDGLASLWLENNWDFHDLGNMYNEIDLEGFFVSGKYGKTFLSPDKNYKAEFFCEVYPDYADYYLDFLSKKNVLKRRIKFLKGFPVIELVFGFYNTAFWRDTNSFSLQDGNKEIAYIFDINADTVSIEFSPKWNTLEVLKNYVGAFESSVSHNERKKLLGF